MVSSRASISGLEALVVVSVNLSSTWKPKALGQIREIELGRCFGDLLGEALSVIIVFLGLLPLGPLVDFAVLVRIDAHPGFHLLNPRTGAHVIVCGLCDEIESSLRESDVGIGMALADLPAKGRRACLCSRM